jgi:hypothetical protein
MKKLAAAFVPALFVAACGSSDSDSTDTSTVNLNITDAPIDMAAEVVVEFTAVEFKPKSGSSFTIELKEAVTLNLLVLQGSKNAPLIADEVIPAGEYNWLRLHIGDGNYITLTEGGLQMPLDIPSGDNNGLKLNSGFTLAVGGISDFTIDFDLRKSIVANKQGFKLRPTLRMIDHLEVGTIVGSVTGYNCAEDDSPSVYLYPGHDQESKDIAFEADGITEFSGGPLTTAVITYNADNNSYDYEIGFVATGDYSVAYTCTAQNDTDAIEADIGLSEVKNVSIEAKTTATINF